jgi:glycosyl hydrolase family 15
VAWTRAALVPIAAGAVAVALVSGGSSADPRTPAGLAELPPPFLGTAVVGSGALTAAVDAYGDVVDLRAPGPAGRALIDNPANRQATGSVAADTGIVARVSIGGEAGLPLWRASSVSQRYLPGTNVVRTVARFGRVRVAVSDAAVGDELARVIDVAAPPGTRVRPAFGVNIEAGVHCGEDRRRRRLALVCSSGPRERLAGARAQQIIGGAATGDRRWIGRARPLGSGAPGWARSMYLRSLLALRALTARRSGAVAAGARDGWAYVWPRDAGTAALAFAAAGYRPEARRVARFLLGLDLGAAARFHGNGAPVAGREAQGDAAGWVAVAAQAAGLPDPPRSLPWHDRPDYQEGEPGDYLANAIAAHAPGIRGSFETPAGLGRRAGSPVSGLDSAAAWAVRPFPLPSLFPAARRTLLRLAGAQTRFGIAPGEAWPGTDPWTAPTAWSAWSLAALGERRAALHLLGDLRRAATPAGALPERVDARTGVPRSTTPLAWPHAFAILALRELWP